MSTGKALVIVSDSLAAVGLVAGVVILLGFMAYAAVRESGVSSALVPVSDQSPSPINIATAPSLLPAGGNLPLLPLAIDAPLQRQADGGYVAEVRNTSGRLLHVSLTLQSDVTHTSKTLALDIPPSGTFEIGRDRDWSLGAGDKVQVVSPDYQPVMWTVP